MRQIKLMLLAAFAALATFVGSTPKAEAGELSFHIQSMYQYKVQIEFYSQNRRHSWPGGNKAYALNDFATHTYSLNCISGERICYGAWVTGNASKYWGVGANNRRSCKGCCAICDGGETLRIVLRP